MLRIYITICLTGCTVWLHSILDLEQYWCILYFKWYNIMTHFGTWYAAVPKFFALWQCYPNWWETGCSSDKTLYICLERAHGVQQVCESFHYIKKKHHNVNKRFTVQCCQLHRLKQEFRSTEIQWLYWEPSLLAFCIQYACIMLLTAHCKVSEMI